MAEILRAVKGMNDIFPASVPRKASETLPTSNMWQWFEAHRALGAAALRLPEPDDAHRRADGAVRARHRRGDRHRREGDVFLRGLDERRQAHAAPRVHRRHRARRHRAQRAVQRPAAPVVHRPAVPPRAPAEGPLPPVPPARRRGAGLRRPRRRRRADPAHARAAARAGPEGGRAHPPRDQQPGPAGRARRAPRRAGRRISRPTPRCWTRTRGAAC